MTKKKKIPATVSRRKNGGGVSVNNNKSSKGKRLLFYGLFLIAVVAFIAYKTLFIICSDAQCLKDYFPLEIGNSYEYEKFIAKGKAPLYCYMADTGYNIVEMCGEDRTVRPDYKKIKIVSKGEKEGEYNLEGEGIEPYLLGRQINLIWAHRMIGNSGIIIHEERVGERTGGTSALAYLLDVPTDIIKQEGLGTEYINDYFYWYFMGMKPYLNVMKCTKIYPAGREQEQVTIERYFAKGIGLIHEIQYNSKRELVYELKLKSYNVN